MPTTVLFLVTGLASMAAPNTTRCSVIDDPCCPNLSAAPADAARAVAVCGGRSKLHSLATPAPTPPPPLVGEQSATPSPTPCKTGTSAERARCLVAQMTLDEKIQLVHGTGWGDSVYVGFAQGVPRLNIPNLTLNDGPQGYRCNGLSICPPGTSTAFPSGLTIGASFDASAAEAWGQAMGAEFYNKGANVQLGPGLCITRVPQGGRNFEYMSGEDPHLGYVMGAAATRGIQSQGVIANAKHYILNNQETYRLRVSVVVSKRVLMEMYMQPFAGAVSAGVGSVMCSYNRIGREYSCENNETLNHNLRDRLGFTGFVMSDWLATHSTSIMEGLDQEMPGSLFFGVKLANGVKDGKIPTSFLDRSVARILAPLFTVGLFDAPNPNHDADRNVSTAASMAVARELAENSTILLKNDNDLIPINAEAVRTIVIVGQGAVNPVVSGGGSGMVNPSYLPSPLASIAGRFNQQSSNNCSAAAFETGVNYIGGDILSGSGDGPEDCCEQCGTITRCLYFTFTAGTCYFKGDGVEGQEPRWFHTSGGRGNRTSSEVTVVTYSETADPATVAAAAAADLAIVFVGTSSSEFVDRGTLGYGAGPDGMISAIAAAQPKTIVVATAPGAVLMPWAPDVASILLGLMPGQMFGDALTNLLFGDVTPSGRLPITIPNAENEQGFTKETFPGVAIDGIPSVAYSEGLLFGYRWYDHHSVSPLYPFGHGLSTTKFSFSGLKASAKSVSFTITNTGPRPGKAVPQLYLGFPAAADNAPKVLRGFTKVGIATGGSTTVTLPLTDRDLSVFDEDADDWRVVTGRFAVFVGASSRELTLTGTFTR